MNRNLCLLIAVIFCSLPAVSQDMYVTVKSIVSTTDGSYGGCLVNFAPRDAIADQAEIAAGTGTGECGRAYLSMDCDGNHITSKGSARLVSAAQLSLVTGKRIYVVVDSSKKNNGYCLASRMDNLDN